MLTLFIALCVTVLDQVLKEAVHRSLHVNESVAVVSNLLHLTYVRNTGAAWGLFSGFSGGLILLSFLMLGLLLCFRRHFLSDTRLHRVAAGLMVGGIIGNLIDRMKLGFVIDYVDFFVGSAHFPAFNVADAAICCGVGIYLLTQAWRSDTAEASPAEPSSPVTPQP